MTNEEKVILKAAETYRSALAAYATARDAETVTKAAAEEAHKVADAAEKAFERARDDLDIAARGRAWTESVLGSEKAAEVFGEAST